MKHRTRCLRWPNTPTDSTCSLTYETSITPGYVKQVTNEYYLEDGSVITGEGSYKILRPGMDKPEPLKVEPGDVTPGGNWQAFISAVRAGDPSMANGNVADAHYGCVLGHLMNNSYRLGTEAPFSRDSGKFGDNEDADKHFGLLHDMMSKGLGISSSEANYTVGPELAFDPETEMFVGDRSDEANKLLKDPDNPGYEVPSADAV